MAELSLGDRHLTFTFDEGAYYGTKFSSNINVKSQSPVVVSYFWAGVV